MNDSPAIIHWLSFAHEVLIHFDDEGEGQDGSDGEDDERDSDGGEYGVGFEIKDGQDGEVDEEARMVRG